MLYDQSHSTETHCNFWNLCCTCVYTTMFHLMLQDSLHDSISWNSDGSGARKDEVLLLRINILENWDLTCRSVENIFIYFFWLIAPISRWCSQMFQQTAIKCLIYTTRECDRQKYLGRGLKIYSLGCEVLSMKFHFRWPPKKQRRENSRGGSQNVRTDIYCGGNQRYESISNLARASSWNEFITFWGYWTEINIVSHRREHYQPVGRNHLVCRHVGSFLGWLYSHIKLWFS